MNLLSLVITVSRRQFLDEALISINNQSNLNFDFIVVVDTHADSSLYSYVKRKLIDLCPKCLKSLTVVEKFGSGTTGMIRNIGFDIAQTEWITYLDDDDIISYDAIDTLLQAIRNDVEEIGMFSSGIFRINSDGKREYLPESLKWKPSRKLFEGSPAIIHNPIYMNQLMIVKKAEWEKYKFVEDMGEDLDFVMNHLLMCRFKKIPQYLYGYRDTVDSLSKRKDIDIFTRRYQNGYYSFMLKENDNEFAAYNLED